MGEVKVRTCDIYNTRQLGGTQLVQVVVNDVTPDGPVEIFQATKEVGKPGKKRVLRMVKAACEPPKKHKQAAAGEGQGDA